MRDLSIAYAHRETWEMMQGVDVEGFYLKAATDGTTPSNRVYTLLANRHEWDVGEMAFHSYLVAYDLGCEDIALPIFPARMVPHGGVFVHVSSGVQEPADLVGKRMGCNSFGTNYSVWWRGMLRHQYDVPIERITWVQSVPEHRADYRPPGRFDIEIAQDSVRSEPLLAEGKIDAATTAGAGQAPKAPGVRPLFADPYAEMRAFVERFGFVPLNTMITVSRSAAAKYPDLPQALFDAFSAARARQERDAPPAGEEVYRRLSRDTGRSVMAYGFAANANAIRHGIQFAYQQGIIRRLYDAEELFLLTDS